MPTIKTTEMGVVVSADGRTLYGDDVIFTIDQKTTFKSLENWTPIFVSEEE
jgi:defect-in-organelle-trafficking protein DotC